jgi:hypothetical protein
MLTNLTISRCSASDSQLLWRLVAELKILPSPRLEPRTLFRGCGLFPCYLFSETTALVWAQTNALYDTDSFLQFLNSSISKYSAKYKEKQFMFQCRVLSVLFTIFSIINRPMSLQHINIYRHSKHCALANFNCRSKKACDIFQCCMKFRCEMKTFRHESMPKTHSMEQRSLERLTVDQLVKIFPAVYETQRLITVFTTASHWSLS